MKNVLITGGTSGLGLQLMKDYLDIGYNVISISRNAEKISNIKKQLQNDKATFICEDVSNIDTTANLAEVISPHFNKLDILINNAGIIHPGGIEKIETAQWNEMININLTSVFAITKALLPFLKKSECANIVNVSSISSKMTGSSIAYSVAKAAIDMMTQSLAKDLAQYGIRVNSVNPGMMDTGFQVSNGLIKPADYDDFLSKVGTTYPLGIGSAIDVSNLIMFITSDKAKWITGSNYIIDGGRSVNI